MKVWSFCKFGRLGRFAKVANELRLCWVGPCSPDSIESLNYPQLTINCEQSLHPRIVVTMLQCWPEGNKGHRNLEKLLIPWILLFLKFFVCVRWKDTIPVGQKKQRKYEHAKMREVGPELRNQYWSKQKLNCWWRVTKESSDSFSKPLIGLASPKQVLRETGGSCLLLAKCGLDIR